MARTRKKSTKKKKATKKATPRRSANLNLPSEEEVLELVSQILLEVGAKSSGKSVNELLLLLRLAFATGIKASVDPERFIAFKKLVRTLIADNSNQLRFTDDSNEIFIDL